MNRAWAPAASLGLLALLAVGAFLFRLHDIEARPIHTDEAVHAYKLGQLLELGFYRYDPVDYKGPTMAFLSAPVALIRGERSHAELTLVTLRLVPLVLASLLIVAPWLGRRWLGHAGAVAAGALLAFSPAFTFYSRYHIHEMLFVLLLVGLACWLPTCVREPARWRLAVAGVLAGLLHATKETCVLAVAALALGAAAVLLAGPGREVARARLRKLATTREGLFLLLPAVGVSMLLYSSFLTQPGGVVDSVRAYWLYIGRGSGPSGHEQPWWWYTRLVLWNGQWPRLWWSEAPIVALALGAGALACLRPRAGDGGGVAFARALAVATIALWAMLSVIPYKTPWNLLAPLAWSALLGGWLVGRVAASPTWWRRGLAVLLPAAACAVLAMQLPRTLGRLEADPRNPWVYGQTSGDYRNLEQRLMELTAVHPDGRAMRIDVVAAHHWPLPWTLRGHSAVGYYTPSAPPTDWSSSVLVLDPQVLESAPEEVQERLVELYGVRPEVVLAVVIDRELWRAFLATRQENAP